MIALFDVTIPHWEGGEPVVCGLSLRMDESSWHEIVGPADSGKTALFDVLTLRRRPTKGKLVVAGRNVDRLKKGGLAKVRRDLGSCPQRPALLWERSAVENVVLPMVVRGDREDALTAAEEVLGFLGIMHERDRPIVEMSSQCRALVGVAMATVGAPKVIVIDGIVEQLEPGQRGVVLSWLERLRKKGSTIVLLGRRPTNRRCDPVVWRLRDGAIERTGEVERC
jgi:ABC-type ATPase involved in cell division